jgi:hypothetical protein
VERNNYAKNSSPEHPGMMAVSGKSLVWLLKLSYMLFKQMLILFEWMNNINDGDSNLDIWQFLKMKSVSVASR